MVRILLVLPLCQGLHGWNHQVFHYGSSREDSFSTCREHCLLDGLEGMLGIKPTSRADDRRFLIQGISPDILIDLDQPGKNKLKVGGNLYIPFSEEISYLGLTLNGRLNWNDHVIKKRSTNARSSCSQRSALGVRGHHLGCCSGPLKALLCHTLVAGLWSGVIHHDYPWQTEAAKWAGFLPNLISQEDHVAPPQKQYDSSSA